ncbi:hypothetical protein, partial [Citrobacter sp. wls617]
ARTAPGEGFGTQISILAFFIAACGNGRGPCDIKPLIFVGVCPLFATPTNLLVLELKTETSHILLPLTPGLL